MFRTSSEACAKLALQCVAHQRNLPITLSKPSPLQITGLNKFVVATEYNKLLHKYLQIAFQTLLQI